MIHFGWLVMVVGVGAFGLIMYAGWESLDIQEVQRESNEITQERLQENIQAQYSGNLASLENMTVTSQWPETTEVVGIQVQCGKEIKTAELSFTLKGSASRDLNATELGIIRNLVEETCN